MSELSFERKPRRMTDPEWCQEKWLPGYTGVEVKMETDPARMAYFARECTWGDVMREPTDEELRDTLREVQRGIVLSAAFKGGVGFRIRASRSSMDQMLRLAEGTGGAGSGAGAQTTRDNDLRHFNIIIPNTIADLMVNAGLPPGEHETPEEEEARYDRMDLYREVVDHMERTRQLYGELVDAGIPPQDVRYVALPLGFQTQWFHVMSLGNMIKMCEQRLCNGLTQHETNYLVRVMRDLVVREHPWMVDNLRSGCEKRGQCVSSTMLFPPCGAFVKAPTAVDPAVGHHVNEVPIRLEVQRYDPDKHLYSANQNDAMQFALWDIERQKLERENPEFIFCMSGPPQVIGHRIAED